ncbi:MAG: hypothetical protein HY021_16270 [Burkholderiales bacterium]|nr:hypothetical protein [Burkholderiales bacterium]
MSHRKMRYACLATIALTVTAAHAGANETLQAAGKAASSVATKTEGAVKRGVKKGTDAVEHAGKATASAVAKGAKKVGLPAASASAPRKATSPSTQGGP